MPTIDPATAQIPNPDATGLLSERPLGQLLAHSFEHHLSGTFELVDDPRQYALVVVEDGRVLRVRTSESVGYLGRAFYEAGLLDDAEFASTLAEVGATRALHGQVLLSRGLIQEIHLTRALAHQRLRKLQHVFTFPPTSRFSFYNAVDLVGPRPHDPDATDPLPSIWRGIVTQPPVEHVRATIAALAGRALRLVRALDMRAFRHEERAAIESLRQWPASVATLATRPGIGPRAAELLAYFLLVTQVAEVAEPVAMPAADEPPPLSARIGFPPGRGEYVQKVSLSMRPPVEEEPPVSPRYAAPVSSRPAVSASVPPFAAEPASARAIAPPTSGVRESFVPSAPASAPSVTPSVAPAARSSLAPGASMAPPAKSEEADRAMADAEMNFLLGDRRQALAFVKVALEHAPKLPSAMALFAALEASNVPKGQEERLQPILKRLDSILLRDPTCRRGRSYRGKIRRRAGDLEGAGDDLRIALEHDPEDVEAARELKIVERLEQQPKGATGLLDRLLGK